MPPECGGIIGSEHGDVITHVVFDKGCPSDAGIMYIPNTQFPNQMIAEWEKSGIKSREIFHTHAPQWAELSNEDRAYIIDILFVFQNGNEILNTRIFRSKMRTLK